MPQQLQRPQQRCYKTRLEAKLNQGVRTANSVLFFFFLRKKDEKQGSGKGTLQAGEEPVPGEGRKAGNSTGIPTLGAQRGSGLASTRALGGLGQIPSPPIVWHVSL